MSNGRILSPPRNLDPQLRLQSQIADLSARLDLVERRSFSWIKKQNLGAAAQSGPSNGTPWPYNTANSVFLDLTPGKWLILGDAAVQSNVGDYASLGMWNDTLGAGISFSASAVSVPAGGTAFAHLSVSHVLEVTDAARYRLWVLPNGASTQTIVGAAALPSASMLGVRVG